MKPDNTLTIGEIIEKTDEKSKMFTDIHYRIMSLISAGTDNENFDEIRKPIESLTEYDVYNNGKPSDFIVREIYKKAFTFLNRLERNKAKAEAMTDLHKIARKNLLKNNDLTLLNETYKAFDNLNKSAIYRAAIEFHERCTPFVLTKEKTKRAKLANKKSRASARQTKAKRIAELEPIKQIFYALYIERPEYKAKKKVIAKHFADSIENDITKRGLEIQIPASGDPVKKEDYLRWIREFNAAEKLKNHLTS